MRDAYKHPATGKKARGLKDLGAESNLGRNQGALLI